MGEDAETGQWRKMTPIEKGVKRLKSKERCM